MDERRDERAAPRPPAKVANERSIARALLIALVLLVLVAAIGAVGIGLVLWHIVGHPEADLVAAVLRRDEHLRDQACQRRTSEMGDVELENLTTAPVPGHAEQTRTTATLILHPPGLRICRAPVRFDSGDVTYSNPSYQGYTSSPHGPPRSRPQP